MVKVGRFAVTVAFGCCLRSSRLLQKTEKNNQISFKGICSFTHSCEIQVWLDQASQPRF